MRECLAYSCVGAPTSNLLKLGELVPAPEGVSGQQTTSGVTYLPDLVAKGAVVGSADTGASDSSTPIGNPIGFQTQYTSPQMQVPLYYRDEDPSATYQIEFIVDAERQIVETQ
jgi:hypothetical protein